MPYALVAVLALLSGQGTTSGPVMKTRWASSVSAASVHGEYPRPQMVRSEWTNLNGRWRFGFVDPATPRPVLSRTILVPFAPESLLSGINEMVPEGKALMYSRAFTPPKRRPGERILLHFGASDWETEVWVNGRSVGRHQGGYDPFSFDISAELGSLAGQPATVEVRVTDPTNRGPQPRGKQVLKPGGIFYRPTSGIWQTVWLEKVPRSYVDSIRTKTSLDGTVQIETRIGGSGPRPEIWAEIYDGDRRVARGWISSQMAESGTTLDLRVPNPKLWTPEHPNLYRVKVGLKGNGFSDAVSSYVGIRTVALGKDGAGRPALTLNGKPTFMFGPLDQGFWPDGLYTAPSDEALKYDIVATKGMGFNMIRKHVKVEPARWYYWADKLGVLVFQDMPSGERSIGPNDPDIERSAESEAIYRRELKAMVDGFHNHPSIVAWVPFNEGWGQFKTEEIVSWLMAYDPTRLVDGVSGWADRKVSHMHDVHVYPGPGAPSSRDGRALVLGEFGGLGLVVPGHTWQKEGWGYQSYQSKEDLTRALEANFFNLRMLKDEVGLSAAVYTQTTDVETEVNGLLTYDRALFKPDLARLKKAVADVYLPAPRVVDVVPTSERTAQEWSYTTENPGAGWFGTGFDASGWKAGPGGFGTASTPGTVVKTVWDGPEIWIRRTFSVPNTIPAKELMLRLHHDEDVEVYLDGRLLTAKKGFTSSYVLLPWPGGALTAGNHTLAIHCKQTSGGQYVDAGIVRLVPRG